MNASNITKLIFKEIMKIYDMPKTITFDRKPISNLASKNYKHSTPFFQVLIIHKSMDKQKLSINPLLTRQPNNCDNDCHYSSQVQLQLAKISINL